MSLSVSSSPVAARFSRPLNLLSSAIFGALYALTITATILCAYFALSGAGKLGPASQSLFMILVGNLGLILGLAFYLGWRLIRLRQPLPGDEFAPRLHVRFAMLFSGAAVLPAVVVGIFFAVVYSQGIESWFSPVVETAVDRAATVAEAAFNAERDQVVSEIRPMAIDLNQQQAVSQFKDGPILYTSYLRRQAELRFFQAAYIIDSSGAILSLAEFDSSPPFAVPTAEALLAADSGSINLHFENEKNLIRGLFRLQAYTDAYLYVARYATGGSLLNLVEAQGARNAYREANSQRGRLTRSFALVYVEAALLVLIGAIWVGLAAANQVVFPIGRLALAAHRVRDGDLDVRVDPGNQNDEVASLARDFNEMTAILGTQRAELIAAHDVSEHRRRFTEAVLSGVSAGVLGVDHQLKITLANSSAGSLLSLDADQLIGKSVLDIAPFLKNLLDQTSESSGQVVQGVVEFESENQHQHMILNVNITPEGKSNDEGFVITFDDMSQLISDQRSAAWREVARRIAHEIRNPLTPIQLSAERIRRKYRDEIKTSPAIFDRCLDTITRQVGDIGRMVDEFSSFARMPEPKIESVDLNELVRETMFGQQVSFPSVKFEFGQTEPKFQVDCDARLSAQAILNVLKNAAEATETGAAKGSDPLIELEISQIDGFAILDVIDNGPGWPVSNRQRLVEPYFTTRQKGTGLGLAIVKRIMEDHHGKLELRDRKDEQQGAVVRLSFPISKLENKQGKT
ncbi:MAG: PAS domain-containing sensor histidine kinase [Robiginitomaculum sp.]|nr:MAG: PAS domain-containing sensor histidine kinase [Robiginitomaculum sp.]